MAFTDDYDKSTPDGSDNPTEGDDRIREAKRATAERLNVEHVFDFDGDEVSHADSGKHTDITTTSITNAGTLANTGLATLQSLTLASGATIVEISTDGTLAGDADTVVPTEKAVKAYVDDVGMFGVANYASYREKQNDGAAGATLALGWQTCELNEEQADDLTLGFASNAITLPADGGGTYIIKAVGSFYLGTAYNAFTKLRLRKTNGSAATKLTGISVHSHSSTSAGHHTHVVTMQGRITLANDDVIELQRYCSEQTTMPASSSGEDEVYCQLELWKVA